MFEQTCRISMVFRVIARHPRRFRPLQVALQIRPYHPLRERLSVSDALAPYSTRFRLLCRSMVVRHFPKTGVSTGLGLGPFPV